MDANELLGVKLPDLEKGGQAPEPSVRIQDLKQNERNVVYQTIGALVEALQQYK